MNENNTARAIKYTFYVLKYVYYLYVFKSLKNETPLVFSIIGVRVVLPGLMLARAKPGPQQSQSESRFSALDPMRTHGGGRGEGEGSSVGGVQLLTQVFQHQNQSCGPEEYTIPSVSRRRFASGLPRTFVALNRGLHEQPPNESLPW